jgi:hypothetical protein
MSKLWDEIADEFDGTATSPSTLVIVTGGAPAPGVSGDTRKPWLTDSQYGGMTSESARRSWEAAQRAEARASPASDDAGVLRWIDMSRWDGTPLPQRKWAIKDRVPLNQAGLFSGEGGTGKSIIELTKNVAHVAGKDWLGSLPEPGPAFYLGAEDDVDELHIRIAAIAAHYGVSFKQLAEGGLHVCCLLGEDATLCATNPRTGKVETTALYKRIYEQAGDIKPKNISIDTLSRAFAGNEIDRSQVYGFASHMQALAMVAGGSVTVLSHPSLAGIASGSGISGSTAWHGAFRFRQYLKAANNRTAICASWNLRKTNTAPRAKKSRSVTNAAYSFPNTAYRPLRRRQGCRGRTGPNCNWQEASRSRSRAFPNAAKPQLFADRYRKGCRRQRFQENRIGRGIRPPVRPAQTGDRDSEARHVARKEGH